MNPVYRALNKGRAIIITSEIAKDLDITLTNEEIDKISERVLKYIEKKAKEERRLHQKLKDQQVEESFAARHQEH